MVWLFLLIQVEGSVEDGSISSDEEEDSGVSVDEDKYIENLEVVVDRIGCERTLYRAAHQIRC